MIFLSVLQSVATGAYIAACADADALTANWPIAACLALLNGVFAFHAMRENGETRSLKRWFRSRRAISSH